MDPYFMVHEKPHITGEYVIPEITRKNHHLHHIPPKKIPRHRDFGWTAPWLVKGWPVFGPVQIGSLDQQIGFGVFGGGIVTIVTYS